MSLLLAGLIALLSLPCSADSAPSSEVELALPITDPSQLPPEPVPVEASPDAPPALPPGPLPDLAPPPQWFFSAEAMFLHPTIDRSHETDAKIDGKLKWAPMPRVSIGFGYEDRVILGINYRFLHSDGSITVGEGDSAERHDVRLETHFLDVALMTRGNADDPKHPNSANELGLRTLWLNYEERGPDGLTVPAFDRRYSFSAGPYFAAERQIGATNPRNPYLFSRFEGAALFGDAGHLTPVTNLQIELGLGWSRQLGEFHLHVQTGAHLEGLFWKERMTSEFGYFARGAFDF